VRILLADHHEHPRLVLGMLLAEHQDFDLIGEAVESQCLLTMVEEYSPDLVLLDADLPGLPIGNLISCLQAHAPRPIICVMSSDFARGRLLLNIGADIFVSKVDDPAWLVEKLQAYAKSGQEGGCESNK